MIFGTVILAIWSRVAMMADGYIWNVAGLMGPYNIRVIFCCYKRITIKTLIKLANVSLVTAPS